MHKYRQLHWSFFYAGFALLFPFSIGNFSRKLKTPPTPLIYKSIPTPPPPRKGFLGGRTDPLQRNGMHAGRRQKLDSSECLMARPWDFLHNRGQGGPRLPLRHLYNLEENWNSLSYMSPSSMWAQRAFVQLIMRLHAILGPVMGTGRTLQGIYRLRVLITLEKKVFRQSHRHSAAIFSIFFSDFKCS